MQTPKRALIGHSYPYIKRSNFYAVKEKLANVTWQALHQHPLATASACTCIMPFVVMSLRRERPGSMVRRMISRMRRG